MRPQPTRCALPYEAFIYVCKIAVDFAFRRDVQILPEPLLPAYPLASQKAPCPFMAKPCCCSYIINRALTVAEAAIGHPPVEIGPRKPQIDLDSPVKICNRLSIVSNKAISQTPVVIGLRIPRIDLDSPVKICNRLGVLSEEAIGQTPVVIGLRMFAD